VKARHADSLARTLAAVHDDLKTVGDTHPEAKHALGQVQAVIRLELIAAAVNPPEAS
jgi:hypothetical protein